MRRVTSIKATALTALALAILLVLSAAGPLFAATQPVNAAQPVTDSTPYHWVDPVTNVDVLCEEMSLYAPPELDTAVSYPDVMDYQKYLRFSIPGTESANADAVIVFLGGLGGGNNCFLWIGKNIVASAKYYRGKNIEVWALDRRVNNLEDQTGLSAAEDLVGNPPNLTKIPQAMQLIKDYYKESGITIDGKSFGGWYTDENAPFLSEFGMRVQMESIYTLIKTVFPDQNVRRKKVFIGGQSLGCEEAATFAAWDFDGNPSTTADAGYNNMAGLIGLDGLLTPYLVSINANVWQAMTSYLPSWIKDIVGATSTQAYASTLSGIRDGTIGRLLFMEYIGYVPDTYLGVDVGSMLANWLPDQESLVYRDPDLKTDPRTDFIMRYAMSKDLNEFLSGMIVQKRVRFTNEALFGATADQNFLPYPDNQSSMGFLAGGPVAYKTFPLPGGMPYFPGWSESVSLYWPHDRQYIPSASEPRRTPWTGPLYTWLNYDEIAGTTATRYTKPELEVTDIKTAERNMFEGPSDESEWYYTNRLLVDYFYSPNPESKAYGLYMMHGDDLDKVPQFMRLCGHGTAIGYAKLNGMNTKSMELPNYVHLDCLTAAMDGAPNLRGREILPMIDYLIKTSGDVTPEPPPQPSTVTVTGITPNSGSRWSWGSVSISNLAGTGFKSGATVKLVKGSSTINASNVSVVSSTKITCRLSLWLKSTGAYDVVVTNPDGTTGKLTGGFTVR
jgi:hypothetical protein